MGPDERAGEAPDDLDVLLTSLRALAEEAVRVHRLPADLVHDISQQAFSNLWSPQTRLPTAEAARAEIRRIAQTERQRRRREARRLRVARSPAAKDVFPLCPRLVEFARIASSPGKFRRTLLTASATIARDPGVLRGEQFRLFHLAYVERQDLDEIVRILGRPNRRAVQKRLRRLSRRLEQALVGCMQKHVSPREWPHLLAAIDRPGSVTEKSTSVATPDSATLCGAAHRALEAVIHRGPG